MTEPDNRSAGTKLQLRHAIALGLLHGPTELLPISSSGHTTLVPWLMRWRYAELDPHLRKSFEVALHAGTAAALLVPSLSKDGRLKNSKGASLSAAPRGHRRRSQVTNELGFLATALAPPAFCGYVLGGQVERHLGTPATIVAGLLAGSAAMSAAEIRARDDRRPSARPPQPLPTEEPPKRHVASAGARDGLALGLAQALALVPGVSRSGATFAAARVRGFSRGDADHLSWKVGRPVIFGAALLQGTRLWRAKPSRELTLPLAAGGATAFASTLWSATALGSARRTRLIPTAIVYRCILALLAIRRMRDNAV